MKHKKHFVIPLAIMSLTFVGSVVWFMTPPTVTEGEVAVVASSTPEAVPHLQGKYVVIYLQKMELELHEGDKVLQTLPLLSQGKPGSYYETIGGSYINDYKEPLHFSSIGHVYMPYSVHLFGNYFIHGIPYYPDGREVSSAYSGGCIRLTNENAKIVYEFMARGMPIIVTRDTVSDFLPTQVSTSTFTSYTMTNLMVAAISLEALTQDNVIQTEGGTTTTRRSILPELTQGGDTSVSHLYANHIGEDAFIDLMNQKAEALGLTNTTFTSVETPVTTTQEDLGRFMIYIDTYKSYLRKAR